MYIMTKNIFSSNTGWTPPSPRSWRPWGCWRKKSWKSSFAVSRRTHKKCQRSSSKISTPCNRFSKKPVSWQPGCRGFLNSQGIFCKIFSVATFSGYFFLTHKGILMKLAGNFRQGKSEQPGNFRFLTSRSCPFPPFIVGNEISNNLLNKQDFY